MDKRLIDRRRHDTRSRRRGAAPAASQPCCIEESYGRIMDAYEDAQYGATRSERLSDKLGKMASRQEKLAERQAKLAGRQFETESKRALANLGQKKRFDRSEKRRSTLRGLKEQYIPKNLRIRRKKVDEPDLELREYEDLDIDFSELPEAEESPVSDYEIAKAIQPARHIEGIRSAPVVPINMQESWEQDIAAEHARPSAVAWAQGHPDPEMEAFIEAVQEAVVPTVPSFDKKTLKTYV